MGEIEENNFSIMINDSFPGEEAYRVRPGHDNGHFNVVRKDKYDEAIKLLKSIKGFVGAIQWDVIEQHLLDENTDS